MDREEHLQGAGVVTTDQGKRIQVLYDLYIVGEEHGAESARASVLTRNHVRGSVRPWHDPAFIFTYFGQSMTLETEDGRCVRFFHRDIDGNIAVN
jgi:predicted ATPase